MAQSAKPEPGTLIIDSTTVSSLLAALSLLIIAYGVSLKTLGKATSTKLRGSFLYNCFFVFAPGLSKTGFLGQTARTYGAAYGTSPLAKLWQEYAKADFRWGEADETVISLELLTVFGAGPIALYVCEAIRKKNPSVWFWMIVLATAELYGGFMTFAPEWLTGSQNLDTSNFMYLWVYLFFFNMLWVVFPFFVLWEAYGQVSTALLSTARAKVE